MSFTDLTTLKGMLGIPAADTSRDVYLQLLVDMADQVVLDVFGLSSTAVTSYTDKIDILDDDLDTVWTSRWPVVAVTSYVEDGDALVEGTDFSVSPTGALKLLDEYSTPPPAPRLTRFYSVGREVLVVTYTAGWTGAPPADLRYAATLIAAYAFNTAQRAGLGGERIGQYSYTLAGGATGSGSGGPGGFGIPPEAERILASYRRVFALPN
ncbi:MAG: hypothetical protein KGS10_05530 [Chloroflexi bacterium]|nr:hypothetical protein [Chloroflexota bacterium]